MKKTDETIVIHKALAEKKVELVKGKENMTKEEGLALIRELLTDYNFAKQKMLNCRLKAMEVAAHFGLSEALEVDFAWNAKYRWDDKEEKFIRTHQWNRDKKRWDEVE